MPNSSSHRASTCPKGRSRLLDSRRICPLNRVGKRDHAPGDTPSTVQERHRLDPRPLQPEPQQNADPSTVKMTADMVDDDLGRGSSAWFTRALAVQKQHQTPPEIDFTPPVIGPQWTIIGDYIAGATSPLAAPTPSNLRPSALARKNPGQPATTIVFFGRQTGKMSPPKLQSYRQEFAVLART